MKKSDIAYSVFWVLIISLALFYWGVVLPSRGCSVLNVFEMKECWCIGNHTESSDFGALAYLQENSSITYGGFRCGRCEDFCAQVNQNDKPSK